MENDGGDNHGNVDSMSILLANAANLSIFTAYFNNRCPGYLSLKYAIDANAAKALIMTILITSMVLLKLGTMAIAAKYWPQMQ